MTVETPPKTGQDAMADPAPVLGQRVKKQGASPGISNNLTQGGNRKPLPKNPRKKSPTINSVAVISASFLSVVLRAVMTEIASGSDAQAKKKVGWPNVPVTDTLKMMRSVR